MLRYDVQCCHVEKRERERERCLFGGPRCRSSPAGRGRGSGITAEQCGLSGPRWDLPWCFQAVIKDPGKLAWRFVITELPGPWLPLCHLEGSREMLCFALSFFFFFQGVIFFLLLFIFLYKITIPRSDLSTRWTRL